MEMYDVIIIGGGPAGLTAAIYASRRALKTLVLSADIGGQAVKTFDIENYPGFISITGPELALKFKEQAEKTGAQILVQPVNKLNVNSDGTFSVQTREAAYQSKSIILAFGKKPRHLEVPGEEEFQGRGVTYCATCDAPFFRNKTVVVVGGGNSALDAAILCAKIAAKVYLIHRREDFRAEQHLIDQVDAAPNIEKVLNSEIANINGAGVVKSITLKDGRNIATDGVIVEVGYVVDRALVQDLLDLDEQNQVVVDPVHQTTTVPGIFAAGDLTPTPYKQIIISCGEGAKAALSAFDYLQKITGRRGITADWH